MENILKTIARLTNPHLSKVIGSNRPPAINWKLDPRRIPPPLEFDPLSTNCPFSVDPALRGAQLPPVSALKQMDLRRPYRILCLDGGGVRGVLTVRILMQICKKYPNFLDNVDLICGTSVGGILALVLAAGYTPAQCDEVYEFAMPHIFTHNPWRMINPFRAKYSDKYKQEIMQYYFGNRTMTDLVKPCAVVAFRLDGRKSTTHSFFNKEGWRPAIFSNMPAAAGQIQPDVDLKVWDAAMRTSAAPTYFPVFRGYTDGGIVANNPSIIAVAKAMAHYPTVNPRTVSVLSLGKQLPN